MTGRTFVSKNSSWACRSGSVARALIAGRERRCVCKRPNKRQPRQKQGAKARTPKDGHVLPAVGPALNQY